MTELISGHFPSFSIIFQSFYIIFQPKNELFFKSAFFPFVTVDISGFYITDVYKMLALFWVGFIIPLYIQCRLHFFLAIFLLSTKVCLHYCVFFFFVFIPSVNRAKLARPLYWMLQECINNFNIPGEECRFRHCTGTRNQCRGNPLRLRNRQNSLPSRHR